MPMGLRGWFALSFKLYCVFLTSFDPTNSKGLHRSKFRKRKRKSLSCVYVLHKTSRNWVLSSRSRAKRQRNVQTSVMHMQSCCFAYLNLFWSFPFSLPSPSSGALLKLPKESEHRNRIVWKSLSSRAVTNPDRNMRFQKCLDLCGHSLSSHLMFFGEF